jgi:tetratricopeptide (TPR) repeat protein
VVDEIRALSAQLAQDPGSLVFLRLGELLRRKGQFDAAHRVALTGLERHPHHADAHDLYARILTDKHDYERAFDEWDMALRIAPNHLGALKGLAFLYFKVGDISQAEAHLREAQRIAPEDPGVVQALAMVRGATRAPAAPVAPPPTAGEPPSPAPLTELAPQEVPAPEAAPAESAPEPEPAAVAAPFEEERVFAGLEGAQEGLLLLDPAGRVQGGALRHAGTGADVTDAVAAYLAGVSQEAARAAKLLGLGAWAGLSAEGRVGHVHLSLPRADALLLVVRDRSVPMGRLAIMAQRAAAAARRWLERQG